MESKSKSETSINKYTNFMICDKLLGAYIHCINEYSVKNSDCKIIGKSLNRVHMCRLSENFPFNENTTKKP